jgi:hypothetical protein
MALTSMRFFHLITSYTKKYVRGRIRETKFYSNKKENLKGDKNQEGMKEN